MRIIYSNQVDNYTVTSNSCDANYPVSNVKDVRLSRVFRTTGLSTSDWVKIDSGSTVLIDVTSAVVAAHNLSTAATIKFQGSSDDFTSIAVTGTFVHDTGNMVVYSTQNSYRYWRFFFSDTGNSNGYIEVGRLSLGTYFEPDNGFSVRFKRNRVDTSKNFFSITSQSYGDEGDVYLNFDVNIPFISDTERKAIETFQDSVKKVKPFFFEFDESTGAVLDLTYVNLNSNVGFSHVPNNRWAADFTIREAK